MSLTALDPDYEKKPQRHSEEQNPLMDEVNSLFLGVTPIDSGSIISKADRILDTGMERLSLNPPRKSTLSERVKSGHSATSSTAAGIIHGAIDFGIQRLQGFHHLATMGADTNTPFADRQAVVHETAHQAAQLEPVVQQVLNVDSTNGIYSDTRSFTTTALDVASVVTGAFALAKVASASTKLSSIPPPNPPKVRIDRTTEKLWRETKKTSANDNAFKHWKKHGREFEDLRNAKEYVQEAHDLAKCDKSLRTIRPDGREFVYNPESNTLGVYSEGLPRTLFKPEEGLKYWETKVASIN